MRMPDDYDEHSGTSATVISAIIAVSTFVVVILIVVLYLNDRNNQRRNQTQQNDSVQASGGAVSSDSYQNDIEDLLTGSTLSPEDFDFWDMYPEPTEEPLPTETPEPVVQEDPSTDGKHTRIKFPDGREEWVLISPYLPKHEFDFTQLVCQSNLMKYYENGRKTSFVGVDISKQQDYVDFVRLKKAGIEFVMLRVGARGYGTGQLSLDDNFIDNMQRALDAGLDVGVYFFSQAISVDEAIEEANMVVANLQEYEITYPVAYDMEFIPNDTARTDALSKSEKTDIAKAFLDTVAQYGYKTMIYGNKEWLIREIDMSKLTAYDVWLSQAEDIPDYPYKFTMWQYTFEGSVDGISGNVNMNISFVNYADK